jgi:hypothetical protein
MPSTWLVKKTIEFGHSNRRAILIINPSNLNLLQTKIIKFRNVKSYSSNHGFKIGVTYTSYIPCYYLHWKPSRRKSISSLSFLDKALKGFNGSIFGVYHMLATLFSYRFFNSLQNHALVLGIPLHS